MTFEIRLHMDRRRRSENLQYVEPRNQNSNRILEPPERGSNYRLQLENIKQAEDELVDEFVTKCMLQVKKCKFRDDTEINTRLIEQIIRRGAYDKEVRYISTQSSNPTGHQRTHYHKFDELKFNEIRTDSNNDLTADLHFTLRGKLATMTVKVDTGAEGNILPLRTYLRMYPEHCTGPRPTHGHLKRSLATLTVYTGEAMKHYGMLDLDITLKDYTTRATFFVASPLVT